LEVAGLAICLEQVLLANVPTVRVAGTEAMSILTNALVMVMAGSGGGTSMKTFDYIYLGLVTNYTTVEASADRAIK